MPMGICCGRHQLGWTLGCGCVEPLWVQLPAWRLGDGPSVPSKQKPVTGLSTGLCVPWEMLERRGSENKALSSWPHACLC